MTWKSHQQWYTTNFIYRHFCKHLSKTFIEKLTVKEAREGKRVKAQCNRCKKIVIKGF